MGSKYQQKTSLENPSLIASLIAPWGIQEHHSLKVVSGDYPNPRLARIVFAMHFVPHRICGTSFFKIIV